MSVVSDMLIRLPSDLLSAVGYDRHVTLATAYFDKAIIWRPLTLVRPLKRSYRNSSADGNPQSSENLKPLANNGSHDHTRVGAYGRSITTPTPSASGTAPGLVIVIRRLSTENSANTIDAKWSASASRS